MKKCTNCGKIIPDDNMFCSECGSSIFENVPEPEQSDNTVETVNQDNANNPTNGSLFSDAQFYTVNKSDDNQSIAPSPNREIYNQPVQNTSNSVEHVYEQHPMGDTEHSEQAQQNNQTQAAYGIYQTQPNLYQTPSAPINNQDEEKANVGLVILSILVPAVGLILYCTQKSDKPKSAKSYGKAALISAIVCVVLSIAGAAASFYGAMKLGNWTTSSSFSSSASDHDNDFDVIEDNKDNKKTDAGKEETTKKNEPAAGSFSTTKIVDYDNMQIAINGKVYTLGKTTLQDLVNDGVSFKDNTKDKLDNVIDEDNGESVEIKLNDNDSLSVEFGNFSDSGKALKDCVLERVYYYVDDDEKNVVTFPFSTTMSENEFKEKAGTPSDTSNYSSNDYTSNTYEYKKDSNKYYGEYGYEFDYTDGELYSITMDWLPE